MSHLELKASKRDQKGSLIRGEGKLPAVVYGRHLDAIPVSVDAIDFNKLFDEAGEATIFTLSVDGENHDVLVHAYDRHPVSHKIEHVDFYAIEKGQKVTVSVPLEFVGEAPVVDLNGQVIRVLHEIEVECEPKDLPSHIDVDLTVLKEIGDVIHVSDLGLSSNVVPTLDADEVVVSTSEVQEAEEEDSETAEVDLSEIEVEKKGSEEAEDQDN